MESLRVGLEFKRKLGVRAELHHAAFALSLCCKSVCTYAWFYLMACCELGCVSVFMWILDYLGVQRVCICSSLLWKYCQCGFRFVIFNVSRSREGWFEGKFEIAIG